MHRTFLQSMYSINPYQPKVKETIYEVTYSFGYTLIRMPYTEKGFKEFINKAICNNKDIKYFSVNIIIPDQFQFS